MHDCKDRQHFTPSSSKLWHHVLNMVSWQDDEMDLSKWKRCKDRKITQQGLLEGNPSFSKKVFLFVCLWFLQPQLNTFILNKEVAYKYFLFYSLSYMTQIILRVHSPFLFSNHKLLQWVDCILVSAYSVKRIFETSGKGCHLFNFNISIFQVGRAASSNVFCYHLNSKVY